MIPEDCCARVVEHPAHLARIQTRDTCRGGAGAERAGHAVGGQTALVAQLEAAHGHQHACADVVAERHGTQEASPVDAEFLAGGKRRRHDGTPGMGTRGVVRVVGFVRMSHDAVGERGIDRCGGERRAGNRRRAFPGVRADVAQRGLAGQQLGPRDHRCQRIEQVMLGVFRGFSREHARPGSAHVCAEHAHLPAWVRRCRRAWVEDVALIQVCLRWPTYAGCGGRVHTSKHTISLMHAMRREG